MAIPWVLPAFLLLVGMAAGREPAAPAGAGLVLHSVVLPRAVRELCPPARAEVVPDRRLEDVRITLRRTRAAGAPQALEAICELTGATPVRERAGASGRRYRIALGRGTVAALAAWKRGALVTALERQMVRAAELRAAPVRAEPPVSFLELGYNDAVLQLLPGLNEAQWTRLLGGDWLGLPPGALPPSDRQRILEAVGRVWESAGVGTARDFVSRHAPGLDERGLLLRLDQSRLIHGAVYLQMSFDPQGRGAVTVAPLDAAALSLPLTRTNPYRWLAAGGRGPLPAVPAPQFLTAPIAADFVAAADGTWGSTLLQLAEAAGVEVASDDYLCRYASRLPVGANQRVVLAAKGLPLAEALDAVCRRFGYVWWEKSGCLYFLSGTRPWDWDEEVPEGFFATWRSDLSASHPPGNAARVAFASLSPAQRIGLARLSPEEGEGAAGLHDGILAETVDLVTRLSAVQRAAGCPLGAAGGALGVTPEQLAAAPLLQRRLRSGPAALTLEAGSQPEERHSRAGWRVTQRLLWSGGGVLRVTAVLSFWVPREAGRITRP